MREKIRHLTSDKSFAGSMIILTVCGGLIYALGGWLWWSEVYLSPERVYWGMIANSLQTTSVTRLLEQKTSQSTVRQTVVQSFGPAKTAPSMLSYTTLQQGKSTIKTENIGTSNKDFIRYIIIKSDQKSTNGKALNFSGVVNKWAQSDTPNVAGTKNPSLVSQVSLGLAGGNLIPQANVSVANRDKLLSLLQRSVVFDTNIPSVKKQHVAGRLQYVYASNVQAVGYVGFEKEFAKMVGLKLIDSVKPNDYQGQPATKVEITVDARSHHLASVQYIGQDRRETYSAYGVERRIATPTAKLTGIKLQELVNKVE